MREKGHRVVYICGGAVLSRLVQDAVGNHLEKVVEGVEFDIFGVFGEWGYGGGVLLRVGVVVPGDINVCDLGAVDIDGTTGVANVGLEGGEVCVGVYGGEVVSEE